MALINEMIREMIQDQHSASHFGDGEMLLINAHRRIGFQKGNPQLAQRLKEVSAGNNNRHLVCVSDVFQYLERYSRKARRFWRTYLFTYGPWWDRILLPGWTYYNTFVTRPYIGFKSEKGCGKRFHDMRGIWKGRDIVFIEGEKSHSGVDNDLFDNAQSIYRTLCPPCSAFDSINHIRAEACKQNRNVLLLIVLSPTATVLACDLFRAGYQAISIGHVDIEYKRWRMGARRKVKLERKYVNRALSESQVADAGEKYNGQIITKIN